MGKENISLTQLVTLLINFLLGSAVVVGVAGRANNDAWIAIAGGTFLGFAIIWFYSKLLNRQPGKNLFQLIEYGLGRKISIIITFFYVIYFFYISCRVVRDFEELIATALMPNTPIEVIGITFTTLMGYVVYLGLEVLARTSEIFTPYLFGFLLLLAIFLVGSGHIHLQQIQPLFAEGPKPVVKTMTSDLLFFPFGEMIAFTTILPYVTNQKKRLKTSFLAVGVASFLLMMSTLIQITTIGLDTLQRSSFPLLTAARNVSIGNFIERVDALVVFIIMLGVFVKGSLFFYGGLKGLEHIYRLPFRYFALPLSLIIAIFSILESNDFAEHIKEGMELVPYELHLPFQFCFPIVLFLVILWKQRKEANR